MAEEVIKRQQGRQAKDESKSGGGMEYARLGKSGLWVSRVCMGAMSFGSKKWAQWTIEEEEATPIIKRALELGVNFFDTADAYSNGMSEVILGKVLRENAKREDVVIATKVYNSLKKPFQAPWNDNSGGLGRKHIFDACEASLKRLGTDYIDLYIVHRFDPHVPIEETMEALNDLVRSGKVRYIGASSMYAWQFQLMQSVADKNGWTKFISMQNYYNLTNREEEREMIPYCRYTGVGVTPWSPLDGGFLAGKMVKGADVKKESARAQWNAAIAAGLQRPDGDWEIVERLKKIGEARNLNAAQIAQAWLRAKDGVTSTLIGVSKMYHLEDACAAASVNLTEEEVKSLEEPYTVRAASGMLTAPVIPFKW